MFFSPVSCLHAPRSTDALLVIWQFFNRLYLTDLATPPTQNWKEDFQAMRDREPPDCWDMEFSDGGASPKAVVHKTLRGAATFIPKVPGTTKKQSADCKQVSFLALRVSIVYSGYELCLCRL